MILISELLRKKMNIETPTGDREQEIITRFPAFLFDKGAYSSPTLARASYPLCTCRIGTPRCESYSHSTSLKNGVALCCISQQGGRVLYLSGQYFTPEKFQVDRRAYEYKISGKDLVKFP